MAGAKSGVHVVQLKPLTVVKSLQDGNKFVKWDDEAAIGTPVNLRVDKKGFFLYWTDQNNETEVLDISSIRDARTGKSARTPKEGKLRDSVTMGPSDIPLEDKTVTVVCGSDLVTVSFIHFCCNNREVAQEWTDELVKMSYNLLALNGASTNFLEKAYTRLCLSAERDKIPVKNIFKTFAQHKDDKKRIERALEACGLPCGKGDMISPEKLDFSTFFTFYQNLTSRTEVEKIYESICGSSGKKKGMTLDQLVDFLNNTQRDPRLNEILYPYANHERAKDIIKQYEPNKTYLSKDTLSVDGFLRYLMSEDNVIVAPEKFDQNLDMDQPLSHYFINSSHNTYLTGHQLTGRSSVEIYRQCLLTGCRCVELDCWNGKSSDEEPIITHGYTVVTEILLKEVLEAIADCAFRTSPYPVILSFENHCSPKQQAKMAMYCRKIFGDMLLTEPLSTHPLKPNQPLPSPSQLLRKIIIKNKKKHFPRTQKAGGGDTSIDEDDDSSSCLPLTPEKIKMDLPSVVTAAVAAAASAASVGGEEELDISDVQIQDEGGGEPPPPPIVRELADLPNGRAIGLADAPDMEDSETESASDEEKVVEQAVEDQNEGTAAKESEAGAEMSALVNYIQPVRFHSFEHADKRNRSYEISSFVETQATSLLKEYPVEFVNYNKRQLSRIYPKGMRTDSSNYMPQVFWNAGCQMVALNFQTLDLGMQLNLGIFEYNCRTGYLLKPDFMRRNDRKFDLFTESTVDGIIAGTVSVKIISGQFLSDKRVGTYVEVDMFGLPADTVKRRFKTKTFPANGINPIYDEEPFIFKKVVLPELACLRVSVYEENGKFIGHRVLPVVGLRPGYRHIQLRNESSQPLTLANLFVLITVKDYIPDGLSELADALANPIAYQSVIEKHAHQLALMTDDDDLEEKTDDHKGKRHSQPGEGRNSEERSSHINTSRMSNAGDVGRPSLAGAGGASKPSSGNVNGSVHSATPGSTSPLPITALKRADTLSKTHNTSIKIVPGEENLPEKQPSLLESAEANIKAETIEKIKEQKIVMKVLAKLEKDLQLLQKKHEKVREKEKEIQQQREEKLLKARESKQSQLVKTTSKLAKKLPAAEVQMLKRRSEVDLQLMSSDHQAKMQDLNQSHSQNLCTLSQEQHRAVMELRNKYHEPLYNAIEKAMQFSQAAQLEYLSSLCNRETSELMKRLEAQTKEDMRNLSKKHKDKSEMERVKRELHSKLIDQAVAERQKLNTLLEMKVEELKKQHAEIRKRFDEEKQESPKQILAEFDELCREAKAQYESHCNPNPISTPSLESDIPETTEL